MTPISSKYLFFQIVLAVLLSAGPGCQSKAINSAVMQQIEVKSGKKLRTTPSELRLKTQHAVNPLSAIIETYADRIIAESSDPEIRRYALLWKINGIPTVHKAAFQPDSFLSLLDLWVLSIQMQMFFEEGAGRAALGDWHTLALDGTEIMVALVDTLAREASADGDIEAGKAEITSWCRNHPIESFYFIRKSITVVLASFLDQQALGTFEIVEAVAVGVADLSVQMSAYADYLPKQARWQTELLLEDLVVSEKVDQALAEFIRISGDIDRLTTLAETAPKVAAAERAIVLKALARDLDRALVALDTQRVATLGALEGERIAVMDDVKKERAGMSADITAERIALLKEIERQRQETLARVEAIGKRLLDDALEDSNAKIDHFFVRTFQVGGVLVFVVLCFWAGALYYVHDHRRGPKV